MPARSRIVVLLGVLASGGVAQAVTDVQATLQVAVGAAVQVRLLATNTGDETALTVTSEAATDGDVRGGWLVPRLAGGEATEWNLELPVPEGPGSFVVTGRVRFGTPDGGWRSTLAAAVACARDCAPAVATLSLPYGPIFADRLGLTRLRLANPGGTPVAAVVGLAAPDGIAVQPPEREVTVAAGESADLDFTVENVAGLAGGPYDAVARLTYRDGVARRIALLPTTIAFPDLPEATGGWGPPALAALALAMVSALAARRLISGRRPWRFGVDGARGSSR